MATRKTPSLETLEPRLLQLTLEPRHLFAVWRALECYSDVCLKAVQLGQESPAPVLQAVSEVQAALGPHMSKMLLRRTEDVSPDLRRQYYCRWGEGVCQVYQDLDTKRFICTACVLNERSYDAMEGVGGVDFVGLVDREDHVLETRQEMTLHLERHLREGHTFPREALDRLREEIEQGGK